MTKFEWQGEEKFRKLQKVIFQLKWVILLPLMLPLIFVVWIINCLTPRDF